jgi:predicted dehydrogenase
MKKVKIGIFGLGRGMNYAKSFLLNNAEIVALCERNLEKLNSAKAELNNEPACYTSFDEFIKHDMDAVFLANNFHEHAKYAIECLNRNIHVLSECTANGTMAEGVALVRAAKKSKAIYMLAENYPFMIFNKEMKRIAETNTLGKIIYAEGEYNHPVSKNDTGFAKIYIPYLKHWRNNLPATYYITHSLAPLMYVTGAMPIRVTATPVCCDDIYPNSFVCDKSAIITCLNDDKSVFKVSGCSAYGAHGNSYRFCGTKGQMENVRGTDDKIMLRYNDWDIPEGLEEINFYKPDWNDKDEELIKSSGHGGSDFIVARTFIDCIVNNKKPPFDVFFSTKMSSVAILAHRSILNNGMPYDIPDFNNEEDCKKYENDYLTPFYGTNGEEPTIPSSSIANHKPAQSTIDYYNKLTVEYNSKLENGQV